MYCRAEGVITNALATSQRLAISLYWQQSYLLVRLLVGQVTRIVLALAHCSLFQAVSQIPVKDSY